MKLFFLSRDEDETGISGTGTVAEGCEFSDRRVALAWQTKTPSMTLHPSTRTVVQVQVHGNRTKLIYLHLHSLLATPDIYKGGNQPKPSICFLNHKENKYGLTREGTVAEVARFTNDWVAMRWLVQPHTIEVHPSWSDFVVIHLSQSHTYLTRLPQQTQLSSWLDVMSASRAYRDLVGGDWFQVRTQPMPERKILWVRYPSEFEEILDIEAR